MSGTILNGRNNPLNIRTGTIPDVSGALEDWMQPMSFQVVEKQTLGFQVVEVTVPINFFGIIQPFSQRRLLMKPEGQRAWTWLLLHAEPSLILSVDSVVNYLNIQTRVISQKDNSIYGYIEYELVQDWTGAGPRVIYDSGNAEIPGGNPILDGGQSNDPNGVISGGSANGS